MASTPDASKVHKSSGPFTPPGMRQPMPMMAMGSTALMDPPCNCAKPALVTDPPDRPSGNSRMNPTIDEGSQDCYLDRDRQAPQMQLTNARAQYGPVKNRPSVWIMPKVK